MSCSECQEFLYDSSWEPVLYGGNGERVRRDGGMTPCDSCPKVPKDAKAVTIQGRMPYRDREWLRIRLLRSKAVEIVGKVRKTLMHYLECKSVGSFPDDPIVRRNAALIRSVEDGIEQADRVELMRLIVFAAGKGVG